MNTAIDIQPVTSSGKSKAMKTDSRNWIQKAVDKFQAKRRAKKIIKSLHEAEEIHSGKRKGKSFDDFLAEL